MRSSLYLAYVNSYNTWGWNLCFIENVSWVNRAAIDMGRWLLSLISPVSWHRSKLTVSMWVCVCVCVCGTETCLELRREDSQDMLSRTSCFCEEAPSRLHRTLSSVHGGGRISCANKGRPRSRMAKTNAEKAPLARGPRIQLLGLITPSSFLY